MHDHPASAAATPDPIEPLMTVDEVALLLNVRKKWVYEAASRKAIPCVRVGHFLRFRRTELEAWLNANATAATEIGDRRFKHYVPLQPAPRRP